MKQPHRVTNQTEHQRKQKTTKPRLKHWTEQYETVSMLKANT